MSDENTDIKPDLPEIPDTENVCIMCRRDLIAAEREIVNYFAGLEETSDPLKRTLLNPKVHFAFGHYGNYELLPIRATAYDVSELPNSELSVNDYFQTHQLDDIVLPVAHLCCICASVMGSIMAVNMDELERGKPVTDPYTGTMLGEETDLPE